MPENKVKFMRIMKNTESKRSLTIEIDFLWAEFIKFWI